MRMNRIVCGWLLLVVRNVYCIVLHCIVVYLIHHIDKCKVQSAMLPWLQKKVVIGIELGHSKRYSVFSLLLYCIHMHHIYQIANS
jgi:hypothetical protein